MCMVCKGGRNRNKIKKWESERAKMSEREKKVLEWGDEEVERVEGGLFEFFFSLSIFFSLSFCGTSVRHDVAADADDDGGNELEWENRKEVLYSSGGGGWQKKYVHSQLSLTQISHFFPPSFLCSLKHHECFMYCHIFWAWISLGEIYMCTSSVHYITVELLSTKKWARNINIVIEWIDKRAFLPLLRWLHTSEWIDDFFVNLEDFSFEWGWPAKRFVKIKKGGLLINTQHSLTRNLF